MLSGSARRPFLLGATGGAPGPTVYSSGRQAPPLCCRVGGEGQAANELLTKGSRVTLNTIALELVPLNVDGGHERALEDAAKVVQLSAETGLGGRIRHVMIPGMIAEEDDRPVPMQPKLDVLEFWSIIRP